MSGISTKQVVTIALIVLSVFILTLTSVTTRAYAADAPAATLQIQPYACTPEQLSQHWTPDVLLVDGGSSARCIPPEQTPTGLTGAQGDKATPKGTCSYLQFSFNDCIWTPALTAIGGFFLALGAAVLVMAGTLFDTLVSYFITGFGQTLTTLGITAAIEAGWTVFRDFSNILIIGFFVFISISTILGVTEYGAKKLLSRVLIIAVLINFSLLFTRIIIDGSNFTALVIYQQMAVTTSGGTFDLAAGFLKPMGITSIKDDSALVTKNFATTQNSATQALLFGLVGGILFFTAAVVIFYGCFLIAARGMLLIFLMLTASIAFASYLIPALASGKYGWSTWWRSLLNGAVFAPMLMLLLAISLAIISKAGSFAGKPTLGSVVANPVAQISGSGWSAIMIYILGIGMLYLSFKVSSGVAGKISGFNVASLGLGRLGVGALGLAALPGGLLGNRLARNAMRTSSQLDDKIKERTRSALDLDPGSTAHGQAMRDIENLRKQKADADKAANRNLNFMSSSIGKAIAARAGIKTGKPEEGYASQQKKIAEEAAKSASDLVVSKKDAGEKALKSIEAELAKQREPHETIIKDTQQVIRSEQESSGLVGQRERANQELAKILKESTVEKSRMDEQLQKKMIDQVQHKEAIDQQSRKIEAAKAAVDSTNIALKAIETRHMEGAVVKHAQDQINQINAQNTVAARRDLADTYHQRAVGNASTVVISENHIHDDTVARMVREKVGKGANESPLMKEFRKLQGGSGSAATGTHAPTEPTHTT